MCLYGENCTPLWHAGNGPDQPPTSIRWQGDAHRQGETDANVFFNTLASRLYKALMTILRDRGVLFAIADDVKITGPPIVRAEIVAKVPTLSMSEAGLKTKATKNRVYV